MFKRLLTLYSNRIYNLPIIVMMPHSGCNCRCVMCDIWKANHNKRELSAEEIQKHVVQFKKLGVREIVLSGGEALMHSNLWKFCEVLKSKDINITLLSTGLLLEKNSQAVVNNFKEVIVSLDGSEIIHDRIRNIPQGFKKLSEGITALKKLKPSFRVTARCVLQRYNYFDFVNIVNASKSISLDQISFLAADISTAAFNREKGLAEEQVNQICLIPDEVIEFKKIIETSFINLKRDYDTGFIAETPAKIRRIAQYYNALNETCKFPKPDCNAPWVSAVIESDGSVMPCFFHKPYGNIYDKGFLEIINSQEAIAFRENLRLDTDPVCRKCVCSLKLNFTKLN